MKNVVILVVVVVAAVAGWYAWQNFSKKMPLDQARERVESMLDAKSRGDNQTALCMWAEGKAFLPMEEISAHSNRFDAFVRKVGMGSPKSYEVMDVQKVGEESVQVTLKLDGRTWTLRVTPTIPIEVVR